MYKKRGYCILCGKRTTHQVNSDWVCVKCDTMALEDDVITEEERLIIASIKKANISGKELQQILKGCKNVHEGTRHTPKYRKRKVTFGVISDSHIGSIYYDGNAMTEAANTFNKRKVDFVIHAGDVCEGHYENKREGSVFELEHIGADAQVKRAVEEFKKINSSIPIYFITGNHEYNTFYKIAGLDIGYAIESKVPNCKYLGNSEGFIDLPFNKHIMVLHPDGGSSYAISYKSQKIAESLEGGKKPEILLIGHFHKAEYIFYRNIHILQCGCLQNQSKFMKGKHLSAHKGYYIVSADVTKNGITKITPEFFPKYD